MTSQDNTQVMVPTCHLYFVPCDLSQQLQQYRYAVQNDFLDNGFVSLQYS